MIIYKKKKPASSPQNPTKKKSQWLSSAKDESRGEKSVQPWETRRNLKKKPKTRRERENGT
jgi:hypothetical protein